MGLPVVKLQSEQAESDTVRWEAPALNCYALQQKVSFKDASGKVISTTEQIPVSVNIGEPSPELFRVPDQITEQPPSVVISEMAKRFEMPCPQCVHDTLALQDKVYYDAQKYVSK